MVRIRVRVRVQANKSLKDAANQDMTIGGTRSPEALTVRVRVEVRVRVRVRGRGRVRGGLISTHICMQGRVVRHV